MEHTNEKTRIVWMMDESLAETHPKDWDTLTSIYTQLMSMIGRDEFNHVIANPVPAFERLAPQLAQKDYKTVIDLTGWSGGFLRTLAPTATHVNDYGMTRVRDVSSPELKTTGYLIKCTPERIAEIKQGDLSDVLMFDDTTVTGGTGVKTSKILGLEGNVDHAYLIANTGQSVPALNARKKIADLGHRLLYGSEINFPVEDGWHLKDLHQIPDLEHAFRYSMQLQELFLNEERNTAAIQKMLTTPEVLGTLFPQRWTGESITALYNQQRFILANGSPPSESTMHAANPTLWASKYLMQHVDPHKVLARREEVLGVLRELKSITQGYERVKPAVDAELEGIARKYI